MHVSRGLMYAVLSASFSALALAPRSASADSYTLYTVDHSASENFSSGDDMGDFVINASASTGHPCGVSATACFKVGSITSGITTYSSTAPTLGAGARTGTLPPARPELGPEWSVTGELGGIFAATYSIGNFTLRGIFDGTDPTKDYLGAGSMDGGLVSDRGTVYFIDGLDDTLVVALDTSISPAPEPGTLTLFGSGCSGLALLMARRHRARSTAE